jgi:ribosomal protein L10
MKVEIKVSSFFEESILKGPILLFFINVDESNISKIAATFYYRSFINNLLEYDVVMTSKNNVNVFDMVREVNICFVSHMR